MRQCDVTGSVTLSDRDRGVTVPDRRGLSTEINPVCFRFMSSMRVPRSVMSCGEMVRVPSRHTLARTALADTQASDHLALRLHGSLLSLLRAYLPPRAAKLWRELCDEFVFPQGCSQGWTELVRLFDLQCVIAELTANEQHFVNRLEAPTWSKFLQILEDARSARPRRVGLRGCFTARMPATFRPGQL